MELSRTRIVLCVLLLGHFRFDTCTGQLQLVTSRRPTESLSLDLVCKAQQDISRILRFYKNDDIQGFCRINGVCDSLYYTISRTNRNTTLTIASVNTTRDTGSWYCQLNTSPGTNSSAIDVNIASLLSFNALSFNPLLTSFTSVRPDKTISLSITTPCTNPPPAFTWKYRQDSSGSFTVLGNTFSSTSESASGCTSDQKKYTNTLNLPGNTTLFYNKNITLRVEVEHDSFSPNENYIKYKDSGNIQFPVSVSSVNINTTNTMNGYEGDSVQLTCTTSASFPAATVTWFKEGTEISEDRSSQPGSGIVVITTSTVRFTVSRTDQDEKIYCQATNIATGSPVKSNEVQLNIFYPPSKPVLTIPNDVCADSQTSLTCISSDRGNPHVNYQWNRNGNDVNTGVTLGRSLWTFTPAKDDNGANVRCSASNTYTERPGYSRVQSDATTLNVHYTPVLTVTGDPTRREGQDLSLNCISDPQDAVVTWSPGGTGQGSTLTIKNLSRSDDRDYICHGRFNQVCTHLQNSTVVHVIVNYAPDIMGFNSITIDEGETLRLSCKAEGRPSQYEFSPFVQYWGDQQAGVHRGVQSGAVYTWAVTDTSYLDTGVYECNVNNGISNRNNILDQRKRVRVVVRGTPVVTSDSSQQVSGEVGSTVHIFQTFYTSSLDIISYNWTFGNTRVIGVVSASSTMVTLETNGVIGKFDGFNVSLFLADFLHEGLYTVNVCSMLGCGSSSVNLIGEGPPLTPLNFTLIFKTFSSVVLRWIPNFSGGINLVQTFVLQHRVHGSAEWKNTTVDGDNDQAGCYVYVQVTGLHPGTEYDFRVVGRNNRLNNNEGKFTSAISGKTSDDQPASSSPLVLGLGIILGLTLIIIIALTAVLIKVYRDKSAGRLKENNDVTRHQGTENPSGITHPGYESLDDVTPRAYSQLQVNQDNTVNEHAGYLTLVQDPPVAYETVALHEYENTKSKSKDSPYMNTS